jgi:hypothetical protein
MLEEVDNLCSWFVVHVTQRTLRVRSMMDQK